MTVDAEQWEDRIEKLIEHLAEMPTCWADRERPIVDSDAIVLISVTTDETLGTGERRYGVVEGDPAIPEPNLTVCETQDSVATLLVQVDSWDNDAKARARAICKRIRSRIRRASSELSLDQIATSLASIGPIIAVGRIEDNRQYSRASFEMRLNVAVSDVDEPIHSIETVEVSGTIKDVAGDVKGMPAFTIDLT